MTLGGMYILVVKYDSRVRWGVRKIDDLNTFLYFDCCDGGVTIIKVYIHLTNMLYRKINE